MDLRSLAKTILSGGKYVLSGGMSPLRKVPKLEEVNTPQGKEKLRSLSLAVAGMVGSGPSNVMNAQRLVNGPHNVYQGASSMRPTTIVGRPKVYDSAKVALDAARKIPAQNGKNLVMNTQPPSAMSVLQQRLNELTKRGADTTNVNKQIAKEAQVIQQQQFLKQQIKDKLDEVKGGYTTYMDKGQKFTNPLEGYIELAKAIIRKNK